MHWTLVILNISLTHIYLFFVKQMTGDYQIHVPNVLCVGMHHWGRKQLQIGGVYKLLSEISNPEDKYAVALHELVDPCMKRAYLTREWAFKMQPMLVYAKRDVVLVNDPAVVAQYGKGPQHNCLPVLWCMESMKGVLQHHLKMIDVDYSVKTLSI